MGCGDINYTLFSLEIEENKNGLLKYSTKSDIQKEGSYIWRIFYNGKNISNDYITRVIALSDFLYFEIKIEDNSIKNGSTIDCTDDVEKYLDIYPKDQDGKTVETIECIEAYFPTDLGNEELDIFEKGSIYKFEVNCIIFRYDTFILIKFKKNDTTGIFLFDIKKNKV